MRHLMLMLLLAVVSCRPVEEKTDTIGNARHLLNDGKYEEVIGLLSGDAAGPNASADVRILLASAYAGSVGLDVVQSYNAFEELLFKDALVNKSMSLAATGAQSPEAGVPTPTPTPQSAAAKQIEEREKTERAILGMIEGLNSSTKVVFGLKWIPPEKRGRILRAATELDKIDASSPRFRAAAVYRMIIFSALFMSTLRDTLIDPKRILDNPVKFFCEMDVALLAENMTKLHMEMKLVNVAIEEIASFEKRSPASLRKMVESFGHMNGFFEKNRRALHVGAVMHGALRNEICQ